MSFLRFEHIKKIYPNGFEAVKDFCLNVEKGEFIVLVGPSGCGKTTTLRMLAGLEDISSGTISINDKVINEYEPKDRDIAMVFQNYALYPHMTVRDNMTYGLKFRKVPKEEINRRVEETMKILDFDEILLKRRPGQLSGGQKQRVALGRAIVRKPSVFLMDEPLSNLDAKLRIQMRAEITRIHKQVGATTIYVTHDQTEAMTMASRIVVMNKGDIQQIDTPERIYDYPENTFVAGFVGAPAMNFLNGTYSKGIVTLGNGKEIKLPEKDIKAYESYEGKEIIFGIRPEDIHSEEAFMETWPDSVVESKVVVSELLGATIQLHQEVDGTEFTAIVNSRDFHKPGDMVRMGFDVNKAHFFDKDSTKAIVN